MTRNWAQEASRLRRRSDRERAARLEAEAIAERATRELYGHLRRSVEILEATPDLVGVVDARGRCLHLNQAARRFLGIEPEAELDDLHVRDIYPAQLRSGALRTIYQALVDRGLWEGELTLVGHDGSEVAVSQVTLAHRGLSGEIEYFSAIARDISDTKALREALEHQALHDTLTGLPNRTLFRDRVGHAMARTGRRGTRVAVLFVDVDRFKLVNDSFGHALGDQLLVAVAERLRTVLRGDTTLARLGGDEFVVLCEDLEGLADAEAIAERMANACALPFMVASHELYCTVSIGISLATTSTDDPDALIADADMAMYRAKRSGHGGFEIFDTGMRDHTVRHLETSNALHRALDRGEFRIVYQPCVRLNDRRMVGVEALVRWQHPQRGLLGPGEFIAVAEETGLIVPLGEWVLEEACKQAGRWRRAHPDRPPLTMAVNLSARQLHRGELMDTVAAAVAAADIEPGELCLELTESVMMERTETTLRALEALRELGVRLAMDDFGTGYSSLAYLRRFPLDVVKLDRSFVNELSTHRDAAKIVSVILRMAEALGLTAIAEGVENAGQCDQLRKLGWRLGQGFHFARPQPAETISAALLREGADATAREIQASMLSA